MAFLGRRIKRWRDHLGLTQVQLGERVGATGNTIGKYERGESSPSMRKAEEIATALRVTIYHLLDDEPRQPGGVCEPIGSIYGGGDSSVAIILAPHAADWDGTWPLESHSETWPVPAELLPHDECLVMRMPDESMQPFLRRGDVIVIDPRSRVPRSLAVIVLRHRGVTLVRRYKSAGSRRLLAASNPCFPAVEVDEETAIVGTVVGLTGRNLQSRLAFEIGSPWP